MKNAKGGTSQTRATQRNQHEAPSGQAGKHVDDAREDREKQQENREEMGVQEDHKTQDMEKGKRGTFP